jgi:hypothetical protein
MIAACKDPEKKQKLIDYYCPFDPTIEKEK